MQAISLVVFAVLVSAFAWGETSSGGHGQLEIIKPTQPKIRPLIQTDRQHLLDQRVIDALKRSQINRQFDLPKDPPDFFETEFGARPIYDNHANHLQPDHFARVASKTSKRIFAHFFDPKTGAFAAGSEHELEIISQSKARKGEKVRVDSRSRDKDGNDWHVITNSIADRLVQGEKENGLQGLVNRIPTPAAVEKLRAVAVSEREKLPADMSKDDAQMSEYLNLVIALTSERLKAKP